MHSTHCHFLWHWRIVYKDFFFSIFSKSDFRDFFFSKEIFVCSNRRINSFNFFLKKHRNDFLTLFFSDVNRTHENNISVLDTFSKIQTIEFSISLHITFFYLQFDLNSALHVLIVNQFLQFLYVMIWDVSARTTHNCFKYVYRYRHFFDVCVNYWKLHEVNISIQTELSFCRFNKYAIENQIYWHIFECIHRITFEYSRNQFSKS